MTVPTSYPGIYIQELPSLVHTIQPAPTSIAVFVGYTNPFLTGTSYGIATQLFSFADYQANFGGFFSSPWQPDYLGQAVYQFFQNGAAAFERDRRAPSNDHDRVIAALREKLQRKNEVVAELMEEHVKLKKELGEL